MDQLLVHYGQPQTHEWLDEDNQKQSASSLPQVDAEVCREEWRRAKATVLTQDYPHETIRGVWTMIAAHHAEEFPNLLKLAAFAITCPLQTVSGDSAPRI